MIYTPQGERGWSPVGSRDAGKVLLALISLVALMLTGCNQPMVIEREAQAAAISAGGWKQQWKDSPRVEETRVVAGREVTVRAVNQLAVWTRNDQSAIAVAATPQLAVFGLDANPVANLSDEELIQFTIDTVLSRAGGVAGITVPKSPTLHKEDAVTVEAAMGQLTGTRFKLSSQGVAANLIILRAKSGTDHLIVLGLMHPNADNATVDAFTNAVKSLKHPAGASGQ